MELTLTQEAVTVAVEEATQEAEAEMPDVIPWEDIPERMMI